MTPFLRFLPVELLARAHVLAMLALVLGLGCPLTHGQVVISEIMYHPVEEAAFNADGTPVMDLTEDIHEFIELHNPGAGAVNLSRWKLSGGIQYEFPEGASIQPGQYLVVAKNKARLAAVAAYQLSESALFGPYAGQLSNRGETIRLRNASDELVDGVPYSAQFPWAIGADALGADEEWTGLRNLDYQYTGRSLERVSFAHASADPANWLASPVPGRPSPGKANSRTRARPLPVVVGLEVYQNSNEQRLIRQNQPARINATFSSTNELGRVELEYFADDINLTGETISNIVMTAAGDASNARFTALVPGMADRTIVRYRVVAVRANERSVVSPRNDDPFPWHAYFVTPARTSSKPIYDCFISTASLSRLGSNISGNPRRVTSPDPPGTPRASWNATEPAVFVHDGVVRDIRMRHHGSRYNRNPGRNSFKWFFPRYNQFLETDAIFETDKGNDFVVGHGLFIAAGLPTSSVRYVDLYLNGNGVMQRLEQGEFNLDMLDAYHKAQQRLNPGSDLEPSGEIFKSVGTIDTNGEGPYGRGDGRKLSKAPTWSPLQMYDWTYSLQTHGWKGHTEFKTMLDAMWVARGDTPNAATNPNVPALRAFFTQYFDIDAMLTYLAVENWACPWDDTTQNHFLWRRSNGKWGMLPWDCDAWFGRGDNTPASASIFIGEVGDRSNNSRGPNFFKDGFIKAFREEYKQRLYVLNNTFLHPENITAMGFGSIRAFADARFTAVNTQCGYGVFQRPGKPVHVAPAAGSSTVPNAEFRVGPYTHSAATPQAHAKTLWEIRAADGTYQAPVFKLTSSTNLTRLPIPFTELEFGRTYYWRCTFIDAEGHPSVASTETAFSFGALSGSQTNLVRLVSIDAASVWKYNQANIDLGTAWKERSFNDAAWPSGAPLFALETAPLPEPIRTPLTLGPVTFYFRHRFAYTGPASAGLQLRTVLDDGAVVYLNGTEIWRTRVNNNPPLFTELASANVGDAAYEGPFDIQVNNLVNGENVLAVEVHQSATASSDVVMGVSLEGKVVLTSSSDLVINEVLADNQTAVANGSPATFPDYVELYNTSDKTVNLDGYALSDDILVPTRFLFPAGVRIAPRGFLTVWCDSNTNAPGLHTGFGLNNKGQTLVLFAPSTNGLAVKDSIRFGFQVPDASIGRLADGASGWQLTRPTPGSQNLAQASAPADGVKVNEWLASPVSGEDWFELHNPQSLPAAIGGHYLTSDIAEPTQSPITPLTFIPARGFVVYTADGRPDQGPDHANFKLSASGESLALVSSNRVVLNSVTFGAQSAGVSQGRLPDGGSTIVPFPSTGSPGEPNTLPIPNVVINEVLSHSDPPAEDAIELANVGQTDVNIGGWYLSDDRSLPAKYRFPANTVLPAAGYKVIYEVQFNPDTNAPTSFALSSANGDEVVLSATDAAGNLTGYRALVRFGAAFNGVSFGRVPTSTGTDFAPLQSLTFGSGSFNSLAEFRRGTGQANAAPRISPVVISEIMYHPPDLIVGGVATDNATHEFVELRNTSTLPVPLFDPAYPANTWRVRGGIELNLPQGITLAPGGHLLLVNFHPGTNTTTLNAFRSRFPTAATTPMVGPYQGRLSNSRDRIELFQPDTPQAGGAPDAGMVPYVGVDRVEYADTPPWPVEPDGTGTSLHRIKDTAFGNDPANWTSSSPTPGAGGNPPSTTDTDGDGLPNSFEDANGLDRNNAADALIDSDGDGLRNIDEYLAGTDLRNPASSFRLQAARVGSAGESGIILRFHGVAGRRYSVEFRTGINSGAWTPTGGTIAPTNTGTAEVIDLPPPGTTVRYYRVRLL